MTRLADRVVLITGSTGIAAATAERAAAERASVFFMADESRVVTGQLLNVDGGWSVMSVSPETEA